MSSTTDRPASGHTHEAVIVGAGFGGMGAAIALRRLGIDDLVILDREDDVGGTWHVNRYPGLAVDIPSSTYSYSFEPNPYWSRLYAPGPELKAYSDHVATKYDLRKHMRFGVVVDGARWDDEAKHWAVSLHDGSTLSAHFLLTATGFLSQPKLPEIPGIESFDGTVMHTAKWDDDVELTGRRAAVIGTGATAVQLIPEIAPTLSELTVFQRTAIWVTPKSDGPVPRRLQNLYARLPVTQRIARGIGSSILEALMVFGVLKYRRFKLFNRMAERVAKRHLARQVQNPETRRKLTPDYSFGCKRPTFSNDYYPTFNQPHVHLETTPIARIEPDAIITEDGVRHEIDTLVCATGFNLWDTNFPAIEIIGREGRNLGKWWRDHRFQAYEGVAVPKFPNFFSLNSPYSYSGLSYFTTIESQMKHMTRLITAMRRRGATQFEVTEEANAAFLDRMTERLGDSVFTLGSCLTARSYYFNQHGEATLLRPTSTIGAFREAANFPISDYALT
jgi:cation diffusion facilitator CzcD-associated flavoprotein CzcO